MSEERLIEVPWDAIDADTLYRLVEEFVTREGTDYGEVEIGLDTKVQQILAGLKRRDWVIVVDTAMENTHIIDKHSWKRAQRSGELPS